MKYIVVELLRTCGACPSQWEGRTDNNRPLYVCYRYGWLRAGVGLANGCMEQAVAAAMNPEQRVCSIQFGDDMDGSLDTEMMKHLLKEHFDFSKV